MVVFHCPMRTFAFYDIIQSDTSLRRQMNLYTLIYRPFKVTNGVYLYVYPFDTEIFETEEEAQAKANEMNII